MGDCLFCKIVSGDIPSDKVYEDAQALAFRDINPQAPTHILIVPKVHVENVRACAEHDERLLGRLFALAAELAAREGLAENGFRLVTNCGRDGAQSVNHFHIHLLGGHKLTERMA